MAVPADRRGDERGLRGAGHPGGRRERELLQRVARRGHRSDADRRPRRRHRAARRCPPPSGAPRSRQRRIVVLGATRAELGGSELAYRDELRGGQAPDAALETAGAVPASTSSSRRWSWTALEGVHDCADGGVAVTLTEMAIAGACGFTVDTETIPVTARSDSPTGGLVLRVDLAGRVVCRALASAACSTGRPEAGCRRRRSGRAAATGIVARRCVRRGARGRGARVAPGDPRRRRGGSRRVGQLLVRSRRRGRGRVGQRTEVGPRAPRRSNHEITPRAVDAVSSRSWVGTRSSGRVRLLVLVRPGSGRRRSPRSPRGVRAPVGPGRATPGPARRWQRRRRDH